MEEIKKQIDQLTDQMLYHARKYYVEDAPEISDFEYDVVATGEHVVEDVKGMVLPVFKVKQKLMYYQFGVEVKIVKNRGEKWVVI